MDNEWIKLKQWLEEEIEELNITLGTSIQWHKLNSYQIVLRKMEELEKGE